MARNSAQQFEDINGVVNAPEAHAAPESLDQVRDILFGGHMRAVDARLRALEERLQYENHTLRSDFQKRLTDLEGVIRSELTSHAGRMDDERTARANELRALAAEFEEARVQLERRHQRLEEASGLADAELRDQLIAQGAALSAELSRTAQRLSSELDRSAALLQREKVDTTSLAAALNDVVSRLTGKHPGA